MFGADIKMFTNCRFGMMYWAVGAVIYAYAQQQIYGSLSSSMAVRIDGMPAERRRLRSLFVQA